MRETLNKQLQEGSRISKDVIEKLSSYFEMHNFDDHSLLLREGQIADFLGFITKGIIRTYEYNEHGNEITKFFFKENQFITNLDSYTNCVPSKCTIETITPCTLLIIKKSETLKLPEWPEIFNMLVQKTLITKIEAQHNLRNSRAGEKYATFISNNGDIINRIPLQYIASYLGITPQTLSRIRRSL